MKTLLNYSVDYVFTVKANSDRAPKIPIPFPISSETFLSTFIDLNGKVTKKDMLRLKDFFCDEDYTIIETCSKELEDSTNGYFDLVDLLEAVKSKKSTIAISLDLLYNLDKRILPRVYTICSSSVVCKDIVSVAISCLKMPGDKLGLMSEFICDVQKSLISSPNTPVYVQCKLSASTLKLPTQDKTKNMPVIFVLFSC